MKKKAPLKTLIVDVGTAFITGGIVSSGKDRFPHVEKIERVPISTGTETPLDGLRTILGESLKKLTAAYQKDSFKEVHVVLASPWKTNRIRTIHSKSEKSVSISERTVLKAIDDYKNETPPASGNVDVEAVAVQVKVNGYSTTLSKNVIGKSLTIQFYESEANAAVAQLIETVLHASFPNLSISFHTFPLVSTVALRGLSQETSFMVLDCAGEATEVTVVNEASIQHLSAFPIGYYGIARAFAGKKGGVGDALSRLTLFARGELRDTAEEEAAKKFSEAMEEWKKSLEDVFLKTAEVTPVPRTLYIICDKEPLLWVHKILKETYEQTGIRVEIVSAPLVQNMITLGEAGSYDIFISLAAIFFHIYHKNLIGE